MDEYWCMWSVSMVYKVLWKTTQPCVCWLLFNKPDKYTKMTLLDVGDYWVSQSTTIPFVGSKMRSHSSQLRFVGIIKKNKKKRIEEEYYIWQHNVVMIKISVGLTSYDFLKQLWPEGVFLVSAVLETTLYFILKLEVEYTELSLSWEASAI